MVETIDSALRDNNTLGDPGSGDYKVKKGPLRTVLKRIEGSAGIGAVAVATKAELDAITDKADNAPGFVVGDSTASNNGQYTWDDSGSAWVKVRDLPDTLTVLENIGGTANAITADTATGVDPAAVQAIVLTSPPGTNTGAVTIALNGGSTEDVKAASGSDPAPGDIVEDVATIFFKVGSEWRQIFTSNPNATFDHQGDYDNGTTYTLDQVVTGSDDAWYQLKVASSLNDDPVSGGSGDWLKILDSVVTDNSVTNAKLTTAHSLALSHTVANRSALKALDTTRYNVAFLQGENRSAPFVWDSSDLSGELLGIARTSSAVDDTLDLITSANHCLSTGNAVITTTAVNGLALNTLYYVIKVDDDNYKLAASYANAEAGTAIDLTGTSAVTIKTHRDPLQGIYVTKDADITGASGAWVYGNITKLDVQWFGATNDGSTDSSLAFIRAAEYLLHATDPGGTIYVNGHYVVPAGKVSFWDILATGQKITPADNTLPNGKLVRGTYIAMVGDGYEASRIKVTGSGDGFVWGNFTNISSKRAMSGYVFGIDFIGPGSVGHTSQTIIDNGAQSYSTTTNASSGTTNTDTRCLVFEECVPGALVRNCRFRYFQEGIHQTYGFGFVVDGNNVQYCNIGVFFDTGVTTWTVGSGNEIEVCAVGVYSNNTSKGYIGPSVIEANLAGCEVLINVSKYLTIDAMWNEGSPKSVVMRGSVFAPTLPNSGITIRNVVGLNIDSNGGVVNLRVENCAMNNLVDTYLISSGERFENNIYDNCTYDQAGFDLDNLSITSGYESEVRVIGPTINKSIDNFLHREPLRTAGQLATASSSGPNTTLTLDVANETTQGRIVIEGQWIPSTDYQRQTFRYVGVIKRTAGTATVVEFSATESFVTRYTTTGTNIQNLPAVPNVTISGSATGAQTAGIEIALGTAVGNTATTVWKAELEAETDGITYA